MCLSYYSSHLKLLLNSHHNTKFWSPRYLSYILKIWTASSLDYIFELSLYLILKPFTQFSLKQKVLIFEVSFIYPKNFKLIGSKLQPLSLKTIKHTFWEIVSEASLHFQRKCWIFLYHYYPLHNIVLYSACFNKADRSQLRRVLIEST